MSGFAWVTLATNDSYSLGALVLAHSLRRANTAHQLAILITPGVTEAMRTQLSAVYNVVKVVDILDSRDEANLTLLARPELGITFTKLHCWRLTQFSKCVFLDADTLVLQNCDELFEREELSAAPDAGWPDCFNSGVFVFKPSNDTFKNLIDFAVVHGSFDGGDQGLLNLFFKDWATKDITKHLPFVYNMCSTATYSYLPAFKQFGENLKIIHFIGSAKPWLQVFDTETGLARVSGESHSIGSFVQLWWDLFCTHVHTSLNTEMTRHRLSSCYVYTSSTSTTTHYPDPSFSPPPRSNPRIRSPPPPSHVDSVDYHDNEPYVFIDPWDDLLTENSIPNYFPQQNYDTYSNYNENYNENNQTDNRPDSTYSHNDNYTHDSNSNSNFLNNNHDRNPQTIQHPPHPVPDVVNWHDNVSNDSNVSGGGSYELWNRPTKRDSFLQPERRISMPSITEAPPSQNQHACPSTSAPTPQSTPSTLGRSLSQEEIQETHTECELDPDPDAGLAAALATLTIGSPVSTEQTALQEHFRRQGWEQGNIDYMGRDSFENIWLKISETLNITESADATPQLEETPSASVPDSPVPSKPTISKPLAPLEMPSSDVPKLPTPPATSVAVATSPPPSTAGAAVTSPATPTTPQVATPPVGTPTTPPVTTPITPPVALPTPPPVVTPTPPPVVTPTPPSVVTPTPPSVVTPTRTVVTPTPPTVPTPTTPPVAIPTTPPVATPTTPPVATPATPPVATPTTPPVATPATPPVVTSTLPPQLSEIAPPADAPTIAPQVGPPKSKPVPASHPASPPVIPAKAVSSVSPPTKPTQPSPITPPVSPKSEGLSTKSAQPSTPTVTSPTPPTSPPVDPFETALSAKLKVDPETPGTPPVGAHSTGSDEPPVPPKRKGGKAAQAQEQASKAQPKGGKSGKGKK